MDWACAAFSCIPRTRQGLRSHRLQRPYLFFWQAFQEAGDSEHRGTLHEVMIVTGGFQWQGNLCAAAPVATVNSIPLAYSRESGDTCAHGRHPQTDLAGSHRAVPIKSFARGRDLDAARPAQCAATKIPKAACFQQF
jgi:hypothetical protein